MALSNGVEIWVSVFFRSRPIRQNRRWSTPSMRGYRSLDTARSYLNEEAVGNAIKASGVPRGSRASSNALLTRKTSSPACSPSTRRT